MYKNKHTGEVVKIVSWSKDINNTTYTLSNGETWEYMAFHTNWEQVK